MAAPGVNPTDLSRRIRVTTGAGASDRYPTAAALHSMDDVRASLDLLKQRATHVQHARKQGRARNGASTGPTADGAAAGAAAGAASLAASAVPVSAVTPSAIESSDGTPECHRTISSSPPLLPTHLADMSLSAIQSLHARLRDQILNELQVELAAPDQRFDALVRDGFRELDAARTQSQADEQQRPSHLRVHVTHDAGHSESHPSSASSSNSRSDSMASTPAAPSRTSSGAHMHQLMSQHTLTPASAARAQQLAAHPIVRQLTELLSPKSAHSFTSSPTAAPPRVSSPLYCGGGHRFDRFLSPPPVMATASATPPATTHFHAETGVQHRANRPATHNLHAPQFVVSPPSGWSAVPPHQPLPDSRQGSASRRRNLRSPSPSSAGVTLHPSHPPRLLFVYPPSTPSSSAASPAALHSPDMGARSSTAEGSMPWQQQKQQQQQQQQHRSHPRSFRSPATPASAPTTGRVGFDFKSAATHRPTHSAVPHLPVLVSPSTFMHSPMSAETALASPQPPSQPQRPSVVRPHTESMGRRAHVMRARAKAEGQQAVRSQTAAPTGATSPFRMRRIKAMTQTQTQMRHTAQPTTSSPLRLSNWTDNGPNIPHSPDVAASSLHSSSNGGHASAAVSHRADVSRRKMAAAATDAPADVPDSLCPTQLSDSAPPRQSLFAVRRGASTASSLSRASLQRPPSLTAAPEPLHHDVHMQDIAEGDEMAAALLSARLARGLGSGNRSGASSSTMRSPAVSTRPLQLGSHIFRQHVDPSSSGDTRTVGTDNNTVPAPLSRSESVSEIEEQLEMEPMDPDDSHQLASASHGLHLQARDNYSDRGLEYDPIPFPTRRRPNSNTNAKARVEFDDVDVDFSSGSSASEIEEEDQLRRL